MRDSLLDEIEKLRSEMIRIAREEGIRAERTMRLSKKLDELMNRLDHKRNECTCSLMK